MKKWYILQVLSGKEKFALASLEGLKQRLAGESRFSDSIGDIKIPEEEVFEIIKGKRKLVKQKILPGYILVQIDFDFQLESGEVDIASAKELHNKIVSISGIGAFIGNKDEVNFLPKPVRDDELHSIFVRMGEFKQQASVAKISTISHIEFEVNDRVQVVEGPFNTLSGNIESVDMEKGKVRVKLEIFGMPTPVELDFLQVEKV